MAIKEGDKISVSIFSGKNSADDSYMAKFAKPIGRGKNRGTDVIRSKDIYKKIKNSNGTTDEVLVRTDKWITMDPGENVYKEFQFKRTIDLKQIEKIISSCSQSIQDSIKILFASLCLIIHTLETISMTNEKCLKNK